MNERGYVVIVAGTPGVGKSTVAARVASELGCARVIEPSEVAVSEGLGTPDPERPGTLIIDEERLLRSIEQKLAPGCTVLPTHYPSVFLDDEGFNGLVPFALLLRLNPSVLLDRLTKRGWPRKKVLENVMAEALGSVAQELEPYSDMVIEVDATDKGPDDVVEELFNKLTLWDVGINVDWLSDDRLVPLVVRWGLELDSNE